MAATKKKPDARDVDDEQLFVVNPQLDNAERLVAARTLLDQADSLLAVYCPGTGGHLDFSDHEPDIAVNYMEAVRRLVSDARSLLSGCEPAQTQQQ